MISFLDSSVVEYDQSWHCTLYIVNVEEIVIFGDLST